MLFELARRPVAWGARANGPRLTPAQQPHPGPTDLQLRGDGTWQQSSIEQPDCTYALDMTLGAWVLIVLLEPSCSRCSLLTATYTYTGGILVTG